MKQSALIFGAILIGGLFPQGHEFSFLIRYFLMIMLFYAFLRLRIQKDIIRWQHGLVILSNILLPCLFYFILKPIDITLALAVFVSTIAPTAAATPIIAVFLRAEVEYVTAAVVLSSPIIALVLPVLLPFFVEVNQPIEVMDILIPVVILVFVPMILAQSVRRFRPHWIPVFHKPGNVAFYLFLVNVYLATARATMFIKYESQTEWSFLIVIALTIALFCLIMFWIGQFIIGRKGYRMENGLALGRKNTMFALWVSLTFINPVVALGPIFYIIIQNMYNSWQILKLPAVAKEE